MKRVGYLYEKICSVDNIKRAILKASEHKRNRPNVREILNNIDEYACKIQAMLKNHEYAPSPYRISVIHDTCAGKDREIFKPQFFPDQIIHWSLMLQLQSPIMRGMYAWSCGSIPGRGVHYAKKHIEKIIRQDRKNTKYCLKMDISKFYPSINKVLLKKSFRRLIKDNEVLWLIDTIIDSTDKGIPIGNYTSQWFANWYLQDLDHYIKEVLHVKYYYRYIDDMVLFGRNKKELHKVHKAIELYLSANKTLNIKDNWQVFRFDKRGLDFLGFRFFRTHTVLRKRNALKIRRLIKKISKQTVIRPHTAMRAMSYLGWLKHCNSENFYNKYIKPYVNIKFLKEVISNESRVHYQAACRQQVFN